MSKAIKCDRCGFCFNPEKTYLCKEAEGVTHEYYQRVNFSDMVISTPETTKENKFASRMADVDLCPMCAEEFIVWMANGENADVEISQS